MAKGFDKKEGIDFDQVFSLVVKPSTVRVMLSIVLSKGWSIRQFDFNNAFLNSDLQETVYMQQPKGYVTSSPHQVCKQHKALYGLKQAPRAWSSKLNSTLNQFGFHDTRSNASLFTKFTAFSTIYILVYVDNTMAIGTNPKEISELIGKLNSVFNLKDLIFPWC